MGQELVGRGVVTLNLGQGREGCGQKAEAGAADGQKPKKCMPCTAATGPGVPREPARGRASRNNGPDSCAHSAPTPSRRACSLTHESSSKATPVLPRPGLQPCPAVEAETDPRTTGGGAASSAAHKDQVQRLPGEHIEPSRAQSFCLESRYLEPAGAGCPQVQGEACTQRILRRPEGQNQPPADRRPC